MDYQRAFRDPEAASALISAIRRTCQGHEPIRLMEFCGGHTHAIMRFGIRQALWPAVQLLSGPGCPVCVTDDSDIDRAIALATLPQVMVATFGDMIRVPGSRLSLQDARARGADVRVVYSALDAVALARRYPERQVVMLGIGFETTAPTMAASVLQAHQEGLGNYSVYTVHKLTPPAMRAILDAGQVRLDGVIGPGHVTSIIGWQAWSFLPQDYGIPCAVSGFEPLDILQAIYSLVQSVVQERPAVFNDYGRGVSREGNLTAQAMMARVFTPAKARWRGLGELEQSGLEFREGFADFDAHLRFASSLPEMPPATPRKGCRCGDVLRGMITPQECPLFGKACTPSRPVGPCMVSAEGACAAYYQYGGTRGSI